VRLYYKQYPGWELIMTKFECRTWFPGISEVVWGGGKGYWNPGMGWKLISKCLWVLQDVTPWAKEPRLCLVVKFLFI